MDVWLRNLARLACLLVGALAGWAFYAAYIATLARMREIGVVPSLAPVIPAMVEGVVAVAGVVIIIAKVDAAKARKAKSEVQALNRSLLWTSWVLFAAAIVTSVYANFMHAWDVNGRWDSAMFSAAPALVLPWLAHIAIELGLWLSAQPTPGWSWATRLSTPRQDQRPAATPAPAKRRPRPSPTAPPAAAAAAPAHTASVNGNGRRAASPADLGDVDAVLQHTLGRKKHGDWIIPVIRGRVDAGEPLVDVVESTDLTDAVRRGIAEREDNSDPLRAAQRQLQDLRDVTRQAATT